MNAKDKESSSGKIGRGGLSPIALGRLRADIRRTQGEIDYALDNPALDDAQQERIISRRRKHLKKLKEKLGE